jgi:O-antigen chain-terminating methyltransferase
MFRPTNPDIDVARLSARARIEQARPEWPDPERGGDLDTGQQGIPPPKVDRVARLKRRVRAIPVLGPALVAVNAWRRRTSPRRMIMDLPVLGPGLRWVKSLALLTGTRVRAERVNDLREETEALRNELDELTAELRRREADMGTLILAQRQRVEHVEGRLEGVADRADRMHGDVLFQQRRLDRLLAEGPAATPTAAPPTTAPAAGSHVEDRLAGVYEAFEDRFRGSRAEIKQRQAIYLEAVRAAGAGTAARPVLDIGCGRGEWLELLGEAGLVARGVDINGMAVSTCRAHGLDAAEADMFAALDAAGEGVLGAVTVFHVIEHLRVAALVELLDAARTALAPGGLLILETPNPENLIVGAHTFHNDPTHQAPIPPAVGKFFVEQRGFREAEIWRLHPRPKAERLAGDDPTTACLNELLFGPQDYAVVARRP